MIKTCLKKDIENAYIYSYFFFSSFIHAVLLSFLLMVPIYGNVTDQIFLTHLVSLDEAKKEGPAIPVIRVSDKHKKPVAKAHKIITADKKILSAKRMSKRQHPENEIARPSQKSVPPASDKTADDNKISKVEHQVSDKESSDEKLTVEKDTASSPIPEGETENTVPVQYQEAKNDVISEGEKKAEIIHAEQKPVIDEIQLPEEPKIDEKAEVNSAENNPAVSSEGTGTENNKDSVSDLLSAENEIPASISSAEGDPAAAASVSANPIGEQSGDSSADINAENASQEQIAGTETPGDNAQPYTAHFGAGIALNAAAAPVSEELKESRLMESVPGIPLPEALIPKDIRIEIHQAGESSPDFSINLLRKPYPKSSWKVIEGKSQAVEFTEQKKDIEINGRKNPGIIVAVSDAEKGIYSFSIRNTGQDAREYAIRFILYQGKEKERTKEYTLLSIPPGSSVNFRFVLPDLVFWDDDASFSGVIEDSKSITKFIYDTGLVWRERKD